MLTTVDDYRGLVRFDWYSGTFLDEIEPDLLVSHLANGLDGEVTPGVPRLGYRSCWRIMRGEAEECAVMWGGHNPTPYFQATGESADRVATLLRAPGHSAQPATCESLPSNDLRTRFAHRVSRVDACIDFDGIGAWDDVVGKALSVAKQRGLKKEQAGDWLDPHQRPGEGRTLYIGGRKAAVRNRTYEKGKQLPEAGRPYWVRSETQLKPAKEFKVRAAYLEPVEVWGASAWSGELFERLTGDGVPAVKPVSYRPPDGARAYQHLLRQYGKALESKALEHGGWENLGLVLRDDIQAMREGLGGRK